MAGEACADGDMKTPEVYLSRGFDFSNEASDMGDAYAYKRANDDDDSVISGSIEDGESALRVTLQARFLNVFSADSSTTSGK